LGTEHKRAKGTSKSLHPGTADGDPRPPNRLVYGETRFTCAITPGREEGMTTEACARLLRGGSASSSGDPCAHRQPHHPRRFGTLLVQIPLHSLAFDLRGPSELRARLRRSDSSRVSPQSRIEKRGAAQRALKPPLGLTSRQRSAIPMLLPATSLTLWQDPTRWRKTERLDGRLRRSQGRGR